MKAPDKIYMPNELFSEEWQRHIEGEDTTFIRKDALLEWAKEKDLSSVLYHPDRHYILVELIEKIESL